MKIGVITNATKDGRLQYTKEILTWLLARGATPLLDVETARAAGMPQYGADTETLYGEPQFLIILGGDGTMLRAARQAAVHDTPMLGVNLGTLGYLTDVDRNEGITAIEKVLRGSYRAERRMMLQVGEGEPHAPLALNEVCLLRDGSAKLVTVSISINSAPMDTLRADGVMVSTPTGSTAYNLSAGGPILKPDSEMMVITAVCPHTLYTRPLVVSAGDVVTLQLLDAQDGAAAVSLDGQPLFQLKRQKSVQICKSKYTATVIKTSPLDFYEILRRKMVMQER